MWLVIKWVHHKVNILTVCLLLGNEGCWDGWLFVWLHNLPHNLLLGVDHFHLRLLEHCRFFRLRCDICNILALMGS